MSALGRFHCIHIQIKKSAPNILTTVNMNSWMNTGEELSFRYLATNVICKERTSKRRVSVIESLHRHRWAEFCSFHHQNENKLKTRHYQSYEERCSIFRKGNVLVIYEDIFKIAICFSLSTLVTRCFFYRDASLRLPFMVASKQLLHLLHHRLQSALLWWLIWCLIWWIKPILEPKKKFKVLTFRTSK